MDLAYQFHAQPIYFCVLVIILLCEIRVLTMLLMYRVTQLEEEQQSMSVVLVDAQKKLEEEKSHSHQLSAQVSYYIIIIITE